MKIGMALKCTGLLVLSLLLLMAGDYVVACLPMSAGAANVLGVFASLMGAAVGGLLVGLTVNHRWWLASVAPTLYFAGWAILLHSSIYMFVFYRYPLDLVVSLVSARVAASAKCRTQGPD
jgi:hypothetical protein